MSVIKVVIQTTRAALAFPLILTALATTAHGADPAPRGPPKVIELEALTIEGRVAKPQVFYVLGRSRVEYENLRMQRIFVERILETARKNRF